VTNAWDPATGAVGGAPGFSFGIPGLDPMTSSIIQYLLQQGGMGAGMPQGQAWNPQMADQLTFGYDPTQYQQSMLNFMPGMTEDEMEDPLGYSKDAANYLQDRSDLMTDPAMFATGGQGTYSADAFAPEVSMELIPRPETMKFQQWLANPESFEGWLANRVAEGGTVSTAIAEMREVVENADANPDDAQAAQDAAQILRWIPTTGDGAGGTLPDWSGAITQANQLITPYLDEQAMQVGPVGPTYDPATGQQLSSGGEIVEGPDGQLYRQTTTPSPLAESFREMGFTPPNEGYTAADFLGPQWSQAEESYLASVPEMDAAMERLLQQQRQAEVSQTALPTEFAPGGSFNPAMGGGPATAAGPGRQYEASATTPGVGPQILTTSPRGDESGVGAGTTFIPPASSTNPVPELSVLPLNEYNDAFMHNAYSIGPWLAEYGGRLDNEQTAELSSYFAEQAASASDPEEQQLWSSAAQQVGAPAVAPPSGGPLGAGGPIFGGQQPTPPPGPQGPPSREQAEAQAATAGADYWATPSWQRDYTNMPGTPGWLAGQEPSPSPTPPPPQAGSAEATMQMLQSVLPGFMTNSPMVPAVLAQLENRGNAASPQSAVPQAVPPQEPPPSSEVGSMIQYMLNSGMGSTAADSDRQALQRSGRGQESAAEMAGPTRRPRGGPPVGDEVPENFLRFGDQAAPTQRTALGSGRDNPAVLRIQREAGSDYDRFSSEITKAKARRKELERSVYGLDYSRARAMEDFLSSRGITPYQVEWATRSGALQNMGIA